MSDVLSIVDITVTKARLKAIADSCADRLKLAEDMACTAETKQTVKKLRAELNKEFAEYEKERKELTDEYEKPLKLFKQVYDEYITQPFRNADIALNIKISDVESAQKAEKAENIERYAKELIQAYSLDWLDVSRIMPNVTLSASEKSLRKEVKEAVGRIKSDVDCVNAISDNSELMAEYMKCLSLAQAKMAVAERQHAIEAAEKARALYNQQEELDREAEKRIEQLAPPTVVQEEKTYTMTFTVSGTIEQLKALKAFMIENNINFSNGGNA